MSAVFQRLFADGKIQRILSLCKLLGHAENIGVIAARKTAVARDHHEKRFALGGSRPNGFSHLGNFGKRGDGVFQNLIKRTGLFRAFLGAAQLGCGNKLHCLCDLHGALHAFDARFHIVHGCGHKNTPFYALFKNLSLQVRMASFSSAVVSSVRTPVSRIFFKSSSFVATRYSKSSFSKREI